MLLSACDKVEDLFRKGDDNTSRDSQKAVSSLRGIMAFERKTDLNDAEAEQDKTDRPDKSEDEVGQVVDHSQRIACGEYRDGREQDKRRHHNDGAVCNKPFLNRSPNGEGRDRSILVSFVMR